MAGLNREEKMTDFTYGEILFYGGLAGMVIVVLLSIIITVVLSSSRKRLRRKLNTEYGERL